MMKVIIAIILIFTRLVIGFNILSWIISEINRPELHQISEIEIYLVAMVFDIWLTSHSDVDIDLNRKDN